ncbi:unnamed protein product, partial [Prorocentrum cordatum]
DPLAQGPPILPAPRLCRSARGFPCFRRSMALPLLVLLACTARAVLGRLGSGANLTQANLCGKQGEVCTGGTGCKCDDHGNCAAARAGTCATTARRAAATPTARAAV